MRIEPPPDDLPGDLWGVGGDLEPETLLGAYEVGLFPMRLEGVVGWWTPARRAVLPLDRLYVSRSLARSRRRFEIRVDTAFDDVVRGCADPARPGAWIDAETASAYSRLHRLGHAHSVEAWDDAGLAGGVYGVAVRGLFAAESMFTRRRDASKVALAALVRHLAAAGSAGQRLLDCQWLTPHLASLGAVEIPRAEYRRRLELALGLPDAFLSTRS